MSNLPQEIQKQISDRGDKLTESMKTDNPFNTGYVQGFIDGHESGATEWAEKAQGLVDMLETIYKKYPGSNASILASAALAKYKDVTQPPVKPIEYMPVHPEDARKPGCPKQFPMHLLSAEQAISNHSQTLHRLKERGGLSVHEMLAVATNRPWSYYSDLKWEGALAMLTDILNKEVSNG